MAGLALLLGLFVFSRERDANPSIAVNSNTAAPRGSGQSIEAPYFSGTTREGHKMALFAADLRPDPKDTRQALLQTPGGRIEFTDGSWIDFSATSGVMDTQHRQVALQGGVALTTSRGFLLRTESLMVDMETANADSPNALRVRTPFGTMTAGQAQLRTHAESGAVLLIFTGGVDLLYTGKGTQ